MRSGSEGGTNRMSQWSWGEQQGARGTGDGTAGTVLGTRDGARALLPWRQGEGVGPAEQRSRQEQEKVEIGKEAKKYHPSPSGSIQEKVNTPPGWFSTLSHPVAFS